MREAHKADYTAAVQYITSRMAQINSANINAPGPNPRRINENNSNRHGAARTEFNGVNIRNPFRTFTDLELTRLGERGLAVVEELKRERNNSGRGNSRGRGRGRGGYGRGGRGYRYNRGNRTPNNDQGANAASGGGNRNVNEVNTDGHAGAPRPVQTSSSSTSSVTQSQASTNSNERGAQNGTRFGNNRA